MKTIGVFLIMVAILLLLGYGFYEMIITADIPFWVRAGLTAMAVGLFLVLIALIRERVNDRRREVEEDDFS